MLTKMQNNRNRADGNAKSNRLNGKQFGNSSNVNDSLTLGSSNSAPYIFTQLILTLMSSQITHGYYSGFIFNHQKLNVTMMVYQIYALYEICIHKRLQPERLSLVRILTYKSEFWLTLTSLELSFQSFVCNHLSLQLRRQYWLPS